MNKLMTVSMAALVATTAALGSIITSTPASAETTLTMNVFIPRVTPFYRALMKPWAENVEKATQGRVKVHTPTASMAPPPRQWDMVAKGVADVAMTANAFIRKRVSLPQIAELPFNTPSPVGATVGLWRTQQKFFNKANEYKGMKLLASFVLAGEGMQSTGKPIRSLADLKGFKMRTSPGISKIMLSKLGATVVTSPGVKQFEFISKGTVDGTVTGNGAVISFKYARYLKHVTEFPGKFGNSSFSFIMNKKTWDGLSAQDKKAVTSVSGEKAIRRVGIAWEKFDRKALSVLAKNKVTVEQASPQFIADIKKRVGFLEKGWVNKANKKGVDGTAALAFYRKTAAEVTKQTRKIFMKK
ncbi:MAG: TRAP transporter substrate-binding protein [Rhodospirillaceae bacterium]|jgi:TRAP-type transport system periplasmic protein|nr:TRAP transporter substrate-binding protein [Rhodospirillaceae bacterium]